MSEGGCVWPSAAPPLPYPHPKPLNEIKLAPQPGREGGGGRRAGRPALSSGPGTGTDSLSLHLAGAPGPCAEGLVSPGVPSSVCGAWGVLEFRDFGGVSECGVCVNFEGVLDAGYVGDLCSG